MVDPILIIAALLGSAFLYPLIRKLTGSSAKLIALALTAGMTAAAAAWIPATADGTLITSATAGFSAPLSINLSLGLGEALALTLIFLVGTLALFQLLYRAEDPWDGRRVVLFFVLLLGAAGLVMTRDLFNLFVFMEISALSLYGILSTSRDERVFEGGLKYMVAGGLASAFFLVGTAVVYRRVGTLSIDELILARGELIGAGGSLGLLLLLVAILIELKPAPVNGWAMDTYEAADHGIGALMSAINATAMVMVLVKLLPLFSGDGFPGFTLLAVAGAASFLLSQFGALRQSSFRRMLGYSSAAQVSLIILVIGLKPLIDASGGRLLEAIAGFMRLGDSPYLTLTLLLLINHALAKAGLFWLGSVTRDEAAGAGGVLPAPLRSRPVLLTLGAIIIAALVGLPPFPAFWAKWSLVMALAANGRLLLLGLILLGSLLEAVYLWRFFTAAARSSVDGFDTLGEEVPDDFAEPVPVAVADSFAQTEARGISGALPGIIAATALLLCGALAAWAAGLSMVLILPVAGLALFTLFDLLKLPVKLQLLFAAAGLGSYAWIYLPQLEGMRGLFGIIFIVGSLLQLIAFFNRRGREPGAAGLLVALILSLGALVASNTNLELFFSWELMTLSSFLLILRGRRASAGAFRYIVFSLFSAYLLFAGFGILGETASLSGAVLNPAAAVLIALALLIKLGALGFHIWLPSGYAEAEDDVSSLISSVMSKAGLFLLFFGAGLFASPLLPKSGIFSGLPLNSLLGWIGVATALAGSLMALFQEDIKYTLAYSSMAQVGYMLLTWAMMSHLGWIASLYLATTHLMFKAMLFLAIAGVVMRSGTRLMYQMGGLIKRMPLSFLSVLFAIIALSGVPPLSGFGAKWLMYSALIEKGWYLQAGLAMFASGVAFLYLFRLIHTIFLGQRKAIHHKIKEAPAWLLIPQFIFMGMIMGVSMYPNLLIKPLQAYIQPYFVSTIAWEGYTVISSLGYWNGNAVMYVTMGVFIVPLIWLFIVKGRVYKVEQFNIVYAAERPYKPETTHYAYNFFGHYQKALGFLVDPWAKRFWRGCGELGSEIGGFVRRLNTGNVQTYSLQIMIYLLAAYLILRGGVQW